MKIAFTSKNISPEVGGRIAGYGPDDFTTAKHDDLYLSVLALNDGKHTCVLLGYDLLGIDSKYIRIIRKKCAEIVGGKEAQIMLSCTHTHCGPHTRTLPNCNRLDTGYLENLIDLTVGAVNELVNGEWFDTTVYWYALNCDENVNRRFIGNDNRCTFLPHRPDLEPLADGVRDRELGVICFRDRESGEVRYVIGNYAAHPLAGHTPGVGGHRISADFPGVFRDYLKSELGCESMFLSGAAGDMVPKGHEAGFAAAEKVGTELAMATIRAVISAGRAAAASHRMRDDSLRCGTTLLDSVRSTSRLRCASASKKCRRTTSAKRKSNWKYNSCPSATSVSSASPGNFWRNWGWRSNGTRRSARPSYCTVRPATFPICVTATH